MKNKFYLCIDLKSFYASVECIERGLNPFEINLVVADASRGDGAITLAATPAIKKLGVNSRTRLYKIPKNIEYIIAQPRMHLYMEYSAKIYSILLKFISSDDIHVYSIDESFLDITPYLSLYKKTPQQIAKMIIDDIYNTTGIVATVGIGTNLFLAKVALDICAKHQKDFMGYLDEALFRQLIWHHQPITDIWMIGTNTARNLLEFNIKTLYDIAHYNPKKLYKRFGVNAQYLIDHAWGKEPTEISDIKAYRPHNNSISNSQILFEDYNYQDAYLIMKEMVESNVYQLVEKHLVTNNISLFINYSKNCINPTRSSQKITNMTNSYQILLTEFKRLYKSITNPNYPIRQIGISFNNLKDELYEQFDLFTDIQKIEQEKKIQQTLVLIKNKYGKNAILKGMNLYAKATQKYRNKLIGGHNA